MIHIGKKAKPIKLSALTLALVAAVVSGEVVATDNVISTPDGSVRLNANTNNIGDVTNYGVYMTSNSNATPASAISITSDGAISLQSGGTSVTGGGAPSADATTYINTGATGLGSGTTKIGTGGADTMIGGSTSTNTIAGTTTVTGATEINTAGTEVTTIGSTTAGDVIIKTGGVASITDDQGKGLTVNGTTNTTTLSGGTNTSTLMLQDGSATLDVAGTTGTAKQLISATTNATTTTSAVQIGEAGNTVNTITGLTNNIVGTTNNLGVAAGSTNNIGTGGATTNNIGNADSTNAIAGTTTVTGTTTITGTTAINTTGTANTNIGNTTGTVAMVGSNVGVGTNDASVVNVGSSIGNSTVNFNNNRLQNVANAVAGTDAVNLNQMNASITNVQNQFNSAIAGVQNQVNTNKAGIAGVTAATNLPGLVAGQKYNFGVAWGNYQAYNGIAMGGHARVTDNVTFKVSGSATSGVYAGGAGMSIGF